ncbi:uncharacterized protein LOC134303873 [Trichomycterus rosablanca]|uniref:uncharacterized protein LOC134303873 n=1 Tax=Trichomycterus rosablanca TaxID=2290929 RepID=UPI002F358049
MKQLIMEDSGEYRLRVITNKDDVFSGRPGVILKVTDLQVRITEGSVASGGAVTLTCSTTCTLPGNPTYIWYKNDQPVTNMPTKYNKLYLKCSTDAGNYSCTVEGREDLRSAAKTVRSCAVGFGPEHPEPDSSGKYVAVGMAVVLVLIIIAGALFICKRKTRSAEKHIKTEVKEPQTGQSLQDEVHYSSIQFLPSSTHRAPLSTGARSPRDNTEEERVQYAVVKFIR